MESNSKGAIIVEYIMSFSSFYKAAYARDVLEDSGISAALKKLPPELINSCGTGLYLRTDSIQQARAVLDRKNIVTRGIYLIEREDRNQKKYIRIK